MSAFCDKARELGANTVRLCLHSGVMVSEPPEPRGTCAYDVNMSFERFIEHMERAAKHLGYSPRRFGAIIHRTLIDGEVIECECMEDRSNGGGGGCGSLRAHAEIPLHVQDLPGSTIVCLYLRRRTPNVLGACSWRESDTPDTRKVERLLLRVNNHSTMVFESSVNMASGSVIRQIYITINGIDRVQPGSHAENDIERTVENTIQAVFMGMRLKRNPKANLM
jgi:hypothetical protein